MRINKKVLELRQTLGITQRKFTEGVVSVPTLSRVERDENPMSANALVKILKNKNISVIEFLQEFSPVSFGIKNYQKQLLSYFLTQDLPKLKKLAKKIPNKHGLLTYLVQDMVLTLEGSPVKNEDKSYKILNEKKHNARQGTVWPDDPDGKFSHIPKKPINEYNVTFVHGYNNQTYLSQSHKYASPSASFKVLIYAHIMCVF